MNATQTVAFTQRITGHLRASLRRAGHDVEVDLDAGAQLGRGGHVTGLSGAVPRLEVAENAVLSDVRLIGKLTGRSLANCPGRDSSARTAGPLLDVAGDEQAEPTRPARVRRTPNH